MRTLCATRPKRATWIELCPEAEAYVARDHKGRNTDRELGGISIAPSVNPWSDQEPPAGLPILRVDFASLSERQAEALDAALNIRRQSVSDLIERAAKVSARSSIARRASGSSPPSFTMIRACASSTWGFPTRGCG